MERVSSRVADAPTGGPDHSYRGKRAAPASAGGASGAASRQRPAVQGDIAGVVAFDAGLQLRIDVVTRLPALRVHQFGGVHRLPAQALREALEVGMVVLGDADEIETLRVEAPQVLPVDVAHLRPKREAFERPLFAQHPVAQR